jgi:4-amino-4-deoxy-L-arabinose transferase-like glycosyltransferase
MGISRLARLANRLLPLLLLAAYSVVALAHAALAPLTTGPDELAHYEYMHFIAEHGRLPLNSEERERASYKSDQPPLYHLLAALPASWVNGAGPPFLKRVQDHNRRQLIERTRHAWGLYNTEDELWPYRGEVLRWQVGRWVAIFFGAATVTVTFLMARDLFGLMWGGQGWLAAIGAAAVVAFTPRFVLTGSMLNYETALAFFSALFLWLFFRVVIGLSQPNSHHFILIGLLMGLAIVTKLSAIMLPLEFIGGLWLIKRHQQWPIWWRGALSAGTTTATIVGCWFGFVVYQFNTIAQDGLWIGLLRPLIAADTSDATTNRLLNLLTGGEAGALVASENLDTGPPWEWLATFFRTFWVAGIEGYQPLGPGGLLLILTICLLAAYGLLLVWRSHTPPVSLLLYLLLIHLAVPLILPLLRYAVTSSLADTAQGRHVLFSAAPAYGILLIWGVSEVTARFSRRAVYSAFIVPGLFLFLWSGVQLWAMTWAYHPLLPVRTFWSDGLPLAKPLNDYVALVEVAQQQNGPLLRLDLTWQARAISPVDYLTEVSLLDKRGNLQAQWLGYSAGGRYPTRAWDPGDLVRDTVWLPVAGLPPGEYPLKLRLIPTARQQEASIGPELPPAIVAASSPPDYLAKLSFTNGEVVRYSAYKEGRALAGEEATSQSREAQSREAVLVILDRPYHPQLLGPAGQLYEPVHSSSLNNSAIFMIGADWPAGTYRLHLTGDTGQATSSPILTVIDRWQRQFVEPLPNRRVEANFAGQAELLGYDLGANRAEPGGGVPLTLYWQALDWMGEEYTIFNKLIAADQTVHGGRDRFPRENYSTLYWVPGEIITDSFAVPVASDAPPGVYRLSIGLYKKVNGQAVSLPLVQDGQVSEISSVDIGPIKIGGPPPGLTLRSATPQFALNQPFGDTPNIVLLGYDLEVVREEAIHLLKLNLYWRSDAPVMVDYTTFVHVLNQAGDVVAQKDQPPLGGAYPTTLWDAGEIIADEVIVSLPADSYRLAVGLYDFQSGQRLVVPGTPDNSVSLLIPPFR